MVLFWQRSSEGFGTAPESERSSVDVVVVVGKEGRKGTTMISFRGYNVDPFSICHL